MPLGHSGVGATRRRTGVCPPAGPGYKEAPRRAEFPGGLGSLLGLPPAPLRDAATVVFHPASEACPSPPTSSPSRWLHGPGGCCAFRGLILALASRAGSAPSAPPLPRDREPGRAIEPSAQRGRLGGAPGGEWSQGLRCTLFPAGWARGCRGCSLHCTHPAECAGGPPRPARQTWRAPGAHGGSGEGAPGLPRRPEGGPVDWVRKVARALRPPGFGARGGGGARPVWTGARRARLGAAGKSGPGRAGEGTGDPGPFFSTGWGERPFLRRLPVKFSALFPRRDWRATPLSFCPRAAGGLGSPSADSEMAPARVGGAGRWGRGVGALGLRSPPNPVGTAWAPGGSAASGRGRVASALKRTWSLNGPLRMPLRQSRREFCRQGSCLPLTIHPSPSGPRWNLQRQLLEVSPVGQSARALLHRGEGFGRVSMKNKLWRPPALALCTSSPRRFIAH